MLTLQGLLRKLTLDRLQLWGVWAMLFSISLFRLGRIGGSPNLALVKFCTLGTLLVWTANMLISRDGRSLLHWLRNESVLLYFLYFGVCFVSLINARYFDEVPNELLERFKAMLSFLLVVALIRDRKSLRWAIFFFALGAILPTLVGLYELASGKAFFKTSFRFGVVAQQQAAGLRQTQYSGASRIQGLICDAGLHGYTMVVYLGVVLPFFFYAKKLVLRLAAGALAFLFFVNLIGTGTRSAWLACAVMGMVFFVFLRHKHKTAMLTACIAGGVLIFLFLSLFPQIPTFERLHTKGNVSMVWRADTYYQAIRMACDHPFFGVGTGNYLNEYHNYLLDRPELSRYYFGWLHNSYLQIWAENGTVGFAVFLALWASIALGLLRTYFRMPDFEMKSFALGLLLAFTGHAVTFSSMPILYQELGGFIMGLAVATAAVAEREIAESLNDINGNHQALAATK